MGRRCIAIVLCLVCLCGCGSAAETEETTQAWTPLQIAWVIARDAVDEDGLVCFGPGEDMYTSYVTELYALATEHLVDGALLLPTGVSPVEIAVLQLDSAEQAEAACTKLTEYAQARVRDFTGYMPEAAATVEKALIVHHGSLAALLVVNQPERAADTLESCFTTAPPDDATLEAIQSAFAAKQEDTPEPEETQTPDDVQEPENTQEPEETQTPEDVAEETPVPEDTQTPGDTQEPEDTQVPEDTQEPEDVSEPEDTQEPEDTPEEAWVYDEARILDAWRTGDDSALADKDKRILEVLAEVIAGYASDTDMTPYDKELAVHDWMVAYAEYDTATLNPTLYDEITPYNDTPYGFIEGRHAICLGYCSTFQLLMDMLDIECITVQGSSYNHTEDHAWNMVRLDGEWYCVDTTWDDPVGSGTVTPARHHTYFNVTSDFLRRSDHQWDASTAPEATATDYAWRG